MITIAKNKQYKNDRVTFRLADAYTLEGIENDFTAAFAADWFSHIPKSRIAGFLELLHGRLQPGAHVVLVDMLWQDHPDLKGYRRDEEENLYHRRHLPDGQAFDVIKNYPTEEELYGYLEGIGGGIDYRADQGLLRWMLAYQVK